MTTSFRCVSLLPFVAALILMSQSAGATQIAYNGFAQSFPIYANDGTGFSGPWEQGGFNAFASGYTANNYSLSFPSLASSTGGSISGGAFSAINGAVRPLASPLGAFNTTVYLSFLQRPNGTLGAGVFNGFFGVTLNGSLSSDLFIGKAGGGATTQYVLETRGDGGQSPSGASAEVGQTALLVLKAQFSSGNDTFTLYANPTPGRPEPTDGDVKSDLYLGTVSEIGVYSTGAFTADEIRIGMAYQDVVPSGAQNGDENSQ